MNLPEGRLRARRVVSGLGGLLADALDRTLTGYLRLEADGLLLDDGEATVLTVEEGVPVAAARTGGDSVGTEALADVGAGGLYRLELRELSAGELPAIHHRDTARIPPTLPAKQLVGDTALVARTREAAPDTRLGGDTGDEPGLDAVESFLDDGETISSIRDRARSEAQARADEWGFETVESERRTDADR
jgi:hypothetical protein